ncbi:MAG: ketopantoate reductase family protein [Candidatus Heimdallarchaeota archaeon]|nr:ketopantoate reductase family protein [Candidatus Heimdallarchaeota archaeon]
MSNELGDILIIGAGAIGGTTGAILYKNNIDVTLLECKNEHLDKIKESGLTIKGVVERVKVPIFSDINKLGRKYKHIIIATKNLETENAVKNINKVLTSESLIYSMQNGFGNTEIMAKYIPKNQIVAGVIGWGASRGPPGEIIITSTTGDFIIGFENRESVGNRDLIDIQKKLSFWKPTIITNNILGFRWAKLIVNSVIASIGGLLGTTFGEQMRNPKVMNAIRALKEEGVNVAKALNISLEKVDNLDVKLFFYKPQPEDGFFTRMKNRTISSIIAKVGARRHGKIRSSLLWDLEHNIKTEIDFLNGYIVKKGLEMGVNVPVNNFLLTAIHEIENGKRNIGMHNLEELEKAAYQN